MRPKTQYAKGDGGAVAYQVAGEGPDLIYIPNWIENIEVMWDEPSYARFLERLASFSRLICFDKRGSGISEAVPFRALPTLEQWMDDIRLVMDAVGSQRAAILGWDVGGLLSMLFAASYPERTSHLVLADAWAWLKRDEGYPIGIPGRAVEAFLTTLEQGFGEPLETPGYLSVMAPSAHADPRFREWFGRYQRLASTPTFALAISRTVFDWDLRPVLPSIRVPTLVMSHQNQWYVRPDHGRFLAENIAGAGLHTGEVEVRGEDIGGIAVHTAARVMSAAGPGEVLVSRTVKDLVAGSGLEFDDRGTHELKGIPGEGRLYAVKG